MTAREEGFLLLTSSLGDHQRKSLTFRQFRELIQRSKAHPALRNATTVTMEDMAAMGYDRKMAERVVGLFAEKERMNGYLRMAKRNGCALVALSNPHYPESLIQLDMDAPTVLWAKGDLSLLEKPAIALVGSRNLYAENMGFARQVGRLSAEKGYVLVSGNARGADQEAQAACVAHGGKVICVVADGLTDKRTDPNILYLSEDSFDLEFSSQRALKRNRIIHSLVCATFVAQSDYGKGGTWSGTINNLKRNLSPVICFRDGSAAMAEYQKMGAKLITTEQLPEILI